MKRPIFIAITGGSGSGKTTLAGRLKDFLGPDQAEILSQDAYYHDQSQNFDEDGGSVNFDHPSALDFDLMIKQLDDLALEKSVELPIYDYATHSRKKETQFWAPKPVVLLDGTLLLGQTEIRKRVNYSLFLEVNEKTRFERRLKRDVEQRGRTPEGVTKQFLSQVKPMHDQFVEPSKLYADFIIRDGKQFEDFCRQIALLLQDRPSLYIEQSL